MLIWLLFHQFEILAFHQRDLKLSVFFLVKAFWRSPPVLPPVCLTLPGMAFTLLEAASLAFQVYLICFCCKFEGSSQPFPKTALCILIHTSWTFSSGKASLRQSRILVASSTKLQASFSRGMYFSWDCSFSGSPFPHPAKRKVHLAGFLPLELECIWEFKEKPDISVAVPFNFLLEWRYVSLGSFKILMAQHPPAFSKWANISWHTDLDAALPNLCSNFFLG